MNKSDERELFKIGVSEAFRRGFCRYGRNPDDIYTQYDNCNVDYVRVIKTILLDPNLICNFFDELEDWHKYSFIRACYIENINLYEVSKDWADRIDEMIKFENRYEGFRELIRRESLMSVASLLSPKFDWSVYYNSLEESIRVATHTNRAWDLPLDMYMKNDEGLYRKFLENSLFGSERKLSHEVRSYLYKRMISGGYLNSKFARKMRSDGSEFASECAVSTLLKNEDLYGNFDELILSFSDSRYESVISTMAKFLPERLLPSIMGAAQRFGNAQWHLNRRFQEIEEASNAG